MTHSDLADSTNAAATPPAANPLDLTPFPAVERHALIQQMEAAGLAYPTDLTGAR